MTPPAARYIQKLHKTDQIKPREPYPSAKDSHPRHTDTLDSSGSIGDLNNKGDNERSAYLRHLRPAISYAFFDFKDIKAALFAELGKDPKIRGYTGHKVPKSLDEACTMAKGILRTTKEKEIKDRTADPGRMLVVAAVRGFNYVKILDAWHVISVVAVKIGNSRTVIQFSNDFEVSEHIVNEYKECERVRKPKHSAFGKFICERIVESAGKALPIYIACGKASSEGLDQEIDPLRIMSANIHDTAAKLKVSLDAALAQSQAYMTHELGRKIATGMYKDLKKQIIYTNAYFKEMKSNAAWAKLRVKPISNRFLIRNISDKYRTWAKLTATGKYWLISICDDEKKTVQMDDYSLWNIPIMEKVDRRTGKKTFLHGFATMSMNYP